VDDIEAREDPDLAHQQRSQTDHDGFICDAPDRSARGSPRSRSV
jgi:hypothetical protein